jgi:hypothetical protein
VVSARSDLRDTLSPGSIRVAALGAERRRRFGPRRQPGGRYPLGAWHRPRLRPRPPPRTGRHPGPAATPDRPPAGSRPPPGTPGPTASPRNGSRDATRKRGRRVKTRSQTVPAQSDGDLARSASQIWVRPRGRVLRPGFDPGHSPRRSLPGARPGRAAGLRGCAVVLARSGLRDTLSPGQICVGPLGRALWTGI